MLFGLLDIFLILDSSVLGYIHFISPVKTGHNNSNISYFLMMIQIPYVNYRRVSYRKNFQEKLIKYIPSISTKLLYSPASVKKKEIAYNGNTGTIKLTLYRSYIDYAIQSGLFCTTSKSKIMASRNIINNNDTVNAN